MGSDEGIDVISRLGDTGEGGILQVLAREDREPDFDLAEPRGMGGVMWKWTFLWR